MKQLRDPPSSGKAPEASGEMGQNQNGLRDEKQRGFVIGPGLSQRETQGSRAASPPRSGRAGQGVRRAQSGYSETPWGSGVCPTWAAADAGSLAED